MSYDRARMAAQLQSAFARLDALIANGVATAATLFASDDPYRGLHIDAQEVQRLLDRPAGAPILAACDVQALPLSSDVPTLHRLQARLGLTAFDLDVVMIALAPEFDLRYERLYAFLQDDVTRKRPRVDLALNLLCSGIEDKVARRAHFLPDAPLLRHRIIELAPDDEPQAGPVLGRALRLDEQVVGWLLGRDALHPLLEASCRLVMPDVDGIEGLWPDHELRELDVLLRDAASSEAPMVVHVQGPRGVGKRRVARLVARERGGGLMEVNLARWSSSARDVERNAVLLAREAVLRRAAVLLRDDEGASPPAACHASVALVERLVRDGVAVVVTGAAPWLPARRIGDAEVIALRLEKPGVEDRAAAWRTALDAAGLKVSSAQVHTLSGRFRLTPGQVSSAVDHARAQVRRSAIARPADGTPPMGALMEAARAQAGGGLARLARKLTCRHRWSDLALPLDAQAQLRELCDQIVFRTTVFDQWGFDRKLSTGKGVSALFCGPPGTGKTMAAEVIASELGLDLYKIDLSRIVDKYIGETEKNLDAVFTAAEDANAILFFDEADALFGKRSEVKDAHDRHANIEVGYLLQKMEEHEGVALLATNLRHHLDDAFVRRMQAIIEFPFPDEEQRHRIWAMAFPADAPLAADADFAALARDVPLAGGHIKNIALASAFLAAAGGGQPIGRAHLVQAVRREYQKLGRAWGEPAWAHAPALRDAKAAA